MIFFFLLAAVLASQQSVKLVFLYEGMHKGEAARKYKVINGMTKWMNEKFKDYGFGIDISLEGPIEYVNDFGMRPQRKAFELVKGLEKYKQSNVILISGTHPDKEDTKSYGCNSHIISGAGVHDGGEYAFSEFIKNMLDRRDAPNMATSSDEAIDKFLSGLSASRIKKRLEMCGNEVVSKKTPASQIQKQNLKRKEKPFSSGLIEALEDEKETEESDAYNPEKEKRRNKPEGVEKFEDELSEDSTNSKQGKRKKSLGKDDYFDKDDEDSEEELKKMKSEKKQAIKKKNGEKEKALENLLKMMEENKKTQKKLNEKIAELYSFENGIGNVKDMQNDLEEKINNSDLMKKSTKLASLLGEV